MDLSKTAWSLDRPTSCITWKDITERIWTLWYSLMPQICEATDQMASSIGSVDVLSIFVTARDLYWVAPCLLEDWVSTLVVKNQRVRNRSGDMTLGGPPLNSPWQQNPAPTQALLTQLQEFAVTRDLARSLRGSTLSIVEPWPWLPALSGWRDLGGATMADFGHDKLVAYPTVPDITRLHDWKLC